MRKLLIGLILCASTALGSTGIKTAQTNAVNSLKINGYHDIQVLYLQTQYCGGQYDSVGFRAISKDDHIVTGEVCNQQISVKTVTR